MPKKIDILRIAVSVAEAATMTGLSRSKLYRDMDKGLLKSCKPGSKPGSRRLIFIDDLLAYIKGEPQTGPKAYAENKQ